MANLNKEWYDQEKKKVGTPIPCHHCLENSGWTEEEVSKMQTHDALLCRKCGGVILPPKLEATS